MDNIDLRSFFKKIVKEAIARGDELASRKGWTVLGTHGSTQAGWWAGYGQKGNARPGKYAHLTDEYIDAQPLDKLQDEMILFIADSFRQR